MSLKKYWSQVCYSAWRKKCWLWEEVGWRGCPATCTPPAETLALLSDDCFVLHGMFSERGLAMSLVGGKIHWMEEFDFLFCVKEENVRNSLWIQHVFHRIITCMEVMLHSNPYNQMKVRVFFFPEQIHWRKKLAVLLWKTVPFWIAYL